MNRKRHRDVLPFPLRPLPKARALGAIEGEHLEHRASKEALQHALYGGSSVNVAAACYHDSDHLRVYLADYNARCQRNRGVPGCSTKITRELTALIDRTGPELAKLRRKGVKGKIPICLLPAKGDPTPAWLAESSVAHERLHARAVRMRARAGQPNRTPAEAARLDRAVRKFIPSKPTRNMLYQLWAPQNRVAGPEEAVARVEELYRGCPPKVRADNTCNSRRVSLRTELQVGARLAGQARTAEDGLERMADALHAAKLTPDDIMYRAITGNRTAKAPAAAQEPARAPRAKAQVAKPTKKQTRHAKCMAKCEKTCRTAALPDTRKKRKKRSLR